MFSRYADLRERCHLRLVMRLSSTSVCQNVPWPVRVPDAPSSVTNVHVTVFLVSLKAGGVALNLTEASRVYLMDSWWNPAVEYRKDT